MSAPRSSPCSKNRQHFRLANTCPCSFGGSVVRGREHGNAYNRVPKSQTSAYVSIYMRVARIIEEAPRFLFAWDRISKLKTDRHARRARSAQVQNMRVVILDHGRFAVHFSKKHEKPILTSSPVASGYTFSEMGWWVLIEICS